MVQPYFPLWPIIYGTHINELAGDDKLDYLINTRRGQMWLIFSCNVDNLFIVRDVYLVNVRILWLIHYDDKISNQNSS